MKSNDVLSIKTPDIKQLYNSLPQNFSTKLALIQGKKLGLKERTIRRYIKDRDLFNNISHGEYIKRVIIEKPEFSSVLSA
jgi:hypothetical protein